MFAIQFQISKILLFERQFCRSNKSHHILDREHPVHSSSSQTVAPMPYATIHEQAIQNIVTIVTPSQNAKSPTRKSKTVGFNSGIWRSSLSNKKHRYNNANVNTTNLCDRVVRIFLNSTMPRYKYYWWNRPVSHIVGGCGGGGREIALN